MEQFSLECAKRTETGTAASRRLRRAKRLPAVVYGLKEDAASVSVDMEAFEKILLAGSRMVTLDVEGKQEPVLISAVQHDSLGDRLVHVDFTRVDLKEKVELAVPVETFGVAKGTQAGGMLDLVMHEIYISCLPTNIPENITVRVGDLEIGDRVTVADLDLPDGVEVRHDPETPVIVVHPPAVEEAVEAEAEEEGEGAGEPEVIAKGKEEDKKEEESDS